MKNRESREMRPERWREESGWKENADGGFKKMNETTTKTVFQVLALSLTPCSVFVANLCSGKKRQD